MTCNVISTGAGDGNAVLLNGGYLFDCGISWKRLSPYAKHIRLVFLTHRHGDHFNIRTLNRLARTYPMIRFVCSKNLLTDLVVRCRIPLDRIILAAPEHSPKVVPGMPGQWLSIRTYDLIHDVENVGYVVRIEGGDEDGTAMYATDTHHIPFRAPGLDLYMVEANHTLQALAARKAAKAAAGEFIYEGRVEASHMSLETAVQWLTENADPDKSRIVFLHQHKERGEENGPVDTSVLQSYQASQDLSSGGQAEDQQQLYQSQCGSGGDAGEPVAVGGSECPGRGFEPVRQPCHCRGSGVEEETGCLR